MSTWLRDSLAELGLSNRHSDCSFVIELEGGKSKSFPCHKLIFSCASDVFDRMLYGEYNESTSGMVKLSDVDPNIFEKFRDYVYGYDCEKLPKYDFDTIIRLCEFANKYLVLSLEEDCIRELMVRKDTFDLGELLRLFQCAHRVNRKSLIDTMSWDLKTTFKRSLDHTGIYEFNWDVFKHYIEVIEGKISEAERFRLLEMYLKYNGFDIADFVTQVEKAESTETEIDVPSTSCPPVECSSSNPSKEAIQPRYVTDLIKLIDFSKFSAKEFYDGPGKSTFLSLAEKYEYMYQIAKNSLLSKSSSAAEQLLSESRRVITLGGTLVREDPTSASLSSPFSPRPVRRFRTFTSNSDGFGPEI
ncbi:uncharacterized protein LOC108100293 isoform X2 [Drosophila ficusphila]|uniref:uncharacterized protein LOC108100293 isoform X2 n=1 Tax=Drosophila ficusphila TaxID=30025 RepID=UPI0007E636BA|nr:uncharacterized protein LOC108100293 isoform X2 [Drosophila ficusphila]